MSKRFSITHRLRSFEHAFAGLSTMLKEQHNARIHLAATVMVCAAGIYQGLDAVEWGFLVLAIVAVWVSEALNTALELLCDVASPGFHPLVKKAKDVAAGAVLVSAFGAVIVGVLIFEKHLL